MRVDKLSGVRACKLDNICCGFLSFSFCHGWKDTTIEPRTYVECAVNEP
jgi:hypothetical protein